VSITSARWRTSASAAALHTIRIREYRAVSAPIGDAVNQTVVFNAPQPKSTPIGPSSRRPAHRRRTGVSRGSTSFDSPLLPVALGMRLIAQHLCLRVSLQLLLLHLVSDALWPTPFRRLVSSDSRRRLFCGRSWCQTTRATSDGPPGRHPSQVTARHSACAVGQQVGVRRARATQAGRGLRKLYTVNWRTEKNSGG
jgi:hypothetical protein